MATNLCRRTSYTRIWYIALYFSRISEKCILVKELFGSTMNILGSESGRSEFLADFIIESNQIELTIT